MLVWPLVLATTALSTLHAGVTARRPARHVAATLLEATAAAGRTGSLITTAIQAPEAAGSIVT